MKPYFIPTKRMQYILAVILLLVLVISLLNFPFTRMLSGDMENDLALKVGWPMTFFELSISDPEKFPLPLYGVPIVVDMIIYVLIAYIIEVIILVLLGLTKNIGESAPIKEDVYAKAKEAYLYYKKQGMSDENVKELFKQKGWTEENIKKVL